MAGGCWEGVMIVVPSFAVTQDATDQIVSRVIVGLVFALAKYVTYRVDRPGDVMHQEHSHQPAPKKSQ